MQTLDQYKPDYGTALLLVGGAGVGKTSLGLRLFTGTYVLVADPNFQSGIDYLTKVGHRENIVGFDMTNIDAKGEVIKPLDRYTHCLACLNVAVKHPKVTTVFLDSASFFEDILKARICGAQTEEQILFKGEKGKVFEQWGQLIILWKSLIAGVRSEGKKLIMAAHENKERDESDGVFKYNIAVDGQIRSKFPALFSDVVRCELTDPPSLGKPPIWSVRPISNPRQEHLKNTLSLTQVITQDEFVRLVQEREKQRATQVQTPS